MARNPINPQISPGRDPSLSPESFNKAAHRKSDVNSGDQAIHHTLGFEAGKAAPGGKVRAALELISNPEFVQFTGGLDSSRTLQSPLPYLIEGICIGGGGSGGGIASTGAGTVAEAGGGAGGTVSTVYLFKDDLEEGMLLEYSRGTGATGASSGNNDGNDGNDSWIELDGNVVCRGTGGGGGNGMAATSSSPFSFGGQSGLGTPIGDVIIPGDDGFPGRVVGGGLIFQGHGGGVPGYAGIAVGSGFGTTGRAGRGIGGGSSGARNGFNGSALGSNSGANGRVFIRFYYV